MSGKTKYYTLLDSRDIYDTDGFLTELSIWEEVNPPTMETTYFIVVGDLDIYGPVEGEDFDMGYADWVEDSYDAAMDFYNDYGKEE